MKHYVLQMLSPSASNYLDLLRVSDLLSLPVLKTQVLYFLVDNFAVLDREYDVSEGDGDNARTSGTGDDSVATKKGMDILKEEFPGLLEELILLRSELSPAPLSSFLLHQVHESKLQAAQDSQQSFPLYSVGTILVVVFIYQQLVSKLDLGIWIPIINVLASAGFLAYIVKSMV